MSGETIITVTGTVHSTPAKARLPSGKLAAAFGLASPRREFDRETRLYRDAEPFFLICAAFGRRAEGVLSTLREGLHVVATGYLTLREGEGEFPYLYAQAVGVEVGMHSITVDDAEAPPPATPGRTPTFRPIPPMPTYPPRVAASPPVEERPLPPSPAHTPAPPAAAALRLPNEEEPTDRICWWSLPN